MATLIHCCPSFNQRRPTIHMLLYSSCSSNNSHKAINLTMCLSLNTHTQQEAIHVWFSFDSLFYICNFDIVCIVYILFYGFLCFPIIFVSYAVQYECRRRRSGRWHGRQWRPAGRRWREAVGGALGCGQETSHDSGNNK